MSCSIATKKGKVPPNTVNICHKLKTSRTQNVATMTFKANKSGAHDDGENDGSLGCCWTLKMLYFS
jgi:hypothetical protein